MRGARSTGWWSAAVRRPPQAIAESETSPVRRRPQAADMTKDEWRASVLAASGAEPSSPRGASSVRLPRYIANSTPRGCPLRCTTVPLAGVGCGVPPPVAKALTTATDRGAQGPNGLRIPQQFRCRTRTAPGGGGTQLLLSPTGSGLPRAALTPHGQLSWNPQLFPVGPGGPSSSRSPPTVDVTRFFPNDDPPRLRCCTDLG